jgi:hypothetical protein
MKKYLNKKAPLIVFVFFSFPLLVGAGIVPACTGTGAGGTVKCDFAYLVKLVKSVLDYILAITAPIAAIMFAYAGFLYMTSQGDPGKRTKANQIFTNVGIGIFFVVGAWLLAKAVLSGLVTKPDFDLLV